MADSDEVELLRRRARRRLIGAAAVVLFLVVVPPMVMDLEPRPVSSNLSVEIPPQPAPPRPGKADGKSAEPARIVASPAPAPAEGRSAEPRAPDARLAETKAAQSAVAEPKPTDSKAAEARPVDVPPTGLSGRPSETRPAPARPEPAPVTPRAAEARGAAAGAATAEPKKPDAAKPADPKKADAARPAEPKKPEVKKAEKADKADKTPDARRAEAVPADAWVVPLGTFSETGNAVKLEQKAQSLGLQAFHEKVVTGAGPRVRVRAGPFVTREQAERARSKLREAGIDALAARQNEKN
jgi:DedD protein